MSQKKRADKNKNFDDSIFSDSLDDACKESDSLNDVFHLREIARAVNDDDSIFQQSSEVHTKTERSEEDSIFSASEDFSTSAPATDDSIFVEEHEVTKTKISVSAKGLEEFLRKTSEISGSKSTSGDTSNSSYLPQKTFAQYTILDKIGEGGYGAVFKAKRNSQIFALKIFKQDLTTSDKDRQRFLREAQLLQSLDHPQVVKIFDVGEDQGKIYFAMEYIEGDTLDQFIEQKITTHQLIRILGLVAKAMHYVHQQGIVHRDLKPSNIMVTRSLQIKIMDFGLAKNLASNDKISRTQEIFGTLLYMSPEQANGEISEIDAQSDVYSLGIILYEILTGDVPFRGDSDLSIRNKIFHKQPVLPTQIRPNISKKIEAICLKAIEKDKKFRYNSAQEFAQDLAQYLKGQVIQAHIITPWSQLSRWILRHRIISMAALLLVAFLITFFSYFVYQINAKNIQLQQEKLRVEQQRQVVEQQRQIAEQQKQQAQNALALSYLDQAQLEALQAKRFLSEKIYVKAQDSQHKIQELLDKHEKLWKQQQAVARQQAREKSTFLQRWNNDLKNYTLAWNGVTKHKFPIPEKAYDSFIYTQTSSRYCAFILDGYMHIYDDISKKSHKIEFNFSSLQKGTLQLFASFSPDEKYCIVFVRICFKRAFFLLISLPSLEISIKELDQQFSHSISTNFSLKFSHDSSMVAYARKISGVTIFKISGLELVEKRKIRDFNLQSKLRCEFSYDSKYLIVYDEIAMYRIDLFSYKIEILSTGARQLVSPTPYLLTFYNQNGQLYNYFYKENLILPFRLLEGVGIKNFAYHGFLLSSLEKNNNAVLWNILDGKKLFTVPLLENEAYLGVQSIEKKICLWKSQKYLLWGKPTYRQKLLQNIIPEFRMVMMDFRVLKLIKKKKIRWSPNNRYLLIEAIQGCIIWDLKNDTVSRIERSAVANTEMYHFSKDNKNLIFKERDNTIIWDIEKDQESRNFPESYTEIPTQNHLNLVKKENRIYQLQNNEFILKKVIPTRCSKISIRKNWALVFSGNRNMRTMEVWDWEQIKLLSSISIQLEDSSLHNCMMFYHDEKFALGGSTGILYLCDWKKQQIFHQVQLDSEIRKIYYDNKRKMFWIITYSGIHVYPDLEEYPENITSFYPLPVHVDYPIIDAAISDDFRYLAIAFMSGELQVMEIDSD